MLTALASEAIARKNPRLLRTLRIAYLKADFREEPDEALQKLGALLAERIGDFDEETQALNKRFFIFDPRHGPEKIAEYVLKRRSDEPLTTLEQTQLYDHELDFGFTEATFRAACRLICRAKLSDAPDLVRRILTWGVVDQRPRYEKLRADLLNALFLPWEAGDPPQDLRRDISHTAKASFKDPRLSPRMWPTEADKAKQIFIRWLTRDSIQMFMDIVGETADRADQWAYRRAFWESYLDSGQIEAAWVAFGPYARYRLAEANKRGVAPASETAVLGGAPDKSHSALLMKIGDLVIVERSHNGFCRIWYQNSARRPELFRTSYEDSELKYAPDETAHTHSETLNWQSRVAAEIFRNTGIEGPKRSSWYPAKK